MHKLAEGGASRSYGVAVAKIAGLPEPVLLRARAMLKDLERGEGPMKRAPRQIGLFEEREAPASREHPVIEALEAVELDRMTPLEALHLLAQLKGMAAKK